MVGMREPGGHERGDEEARKRIFNVHGGSASSASNRLTD
jgi:hypothetical protein